MEPGCSFDGEEVGDQVRMDTTEAGRQEDATEDLGLSFLLG